MLEQTPVVAVICEYDPFHRGHARQFALIRQRLPGAKIVCLMSGCFTQRGMPALHAPAVRARTAMLAGADLVLELPCAFAVRDAEHFALGAVHILSQLGFVDALSFGMEADGADVLAPLREAAIMLETPDASFDAALKRVLSTGAPYAAALGLALAQRIPIPSGLWQQPNNLLALCYLRALYRLQSPLQPLPVPRTGSGYHQAALTSGVLPSATAVRAAFLQGRYAQADEACGYALAQAPVCLPDALDTVLLAKLRASTPDALRTLPYCTEGLENRLYQCARRATTRAELLVLLKTRRYAHTRLSRLCCHALLGITTPLLAAHPLPEYVRLLGFREESKPLLSLLGKSRMPVLSRAADGDSANPLYQLDAHAYDLWTLGARLPAGLMARQGVVRVHEGESLHRKGVATSCEPYSLT
ncbi:MAG: nucleotidyltransferase family protein [Clostridia bacterium]